MITLRVLTVLSLAALAGMLTSCGGGGSSDTASTGSLQVLNNTGQDLADVEVWQGITKLSEIGGGLAQGASWTFSNLAAGSYDVKAFPGGGGVQLILTYFNVLVLPDLTTPYTMTP